MATDMGMDMDIERSRTKYLFQAKDSRYKAQDTSLKLARCGGIKVGRQQLLWAAAGGSLTTKSSKKDKSRPAGKAGKKIKPNS